MKDDFFLIEAGYSKQNYMIHEQFLFGISKPTKISCPHFSLTYSNDNSTRLLHGWYT